MRRRASPPETPRTNPVAFLVTPGAVISVRPAGDPLFDRLRERLALQIMFMVADRHLRQRDPCTSEDLVQDLGLPMQPIHHVLQLMVGAGFLSETSGDPPAYLPRRDVETITLTELYEVVRSAGENRLLCLKTLPHQFEVEHAMEAVQRAVDDQVDVVQPVAQHGDAAGTPARRPNDRGGTHAMRARPPATVTCSFMTTASVPTTTPFPMTTI